MRASSSAASGRPAGQQSMSAVISERAAPDLRVFDPCIVMIAIG